MIDDSQLSFSLPSVSRKKVTAVFDGGRLSSDSGVMLLALVERRRNVAATLAALIADRRDPSHIRHTVAGRFLGRGQQASGDGVPANSRTPTSNRPVHLRRTLLGRRYNGPRRH